MKLSLLFSNIIRDDVFVAVVSTAAEFMGNGPSTYNKTMAVHL
jgi:hypothetical protein